MCIPLIMLNFLCVECNFSKRKAYINSTPFLKSTNAANNMRFTKNGSESKVTNLNFSLVSIDEDVITFEISMDDWRRTAMEIEKPFRTCLITPLLHRFYIHSSMSQPIPTQSQSLQLWNTHFRFSYKEITKTQVAYCLRVPEVKSSVTKLIDKLSVSTQEV